MTSSSVQTELLLRSLPYFLAEASLVLVTHSVTPPGYASGNVVGLHSFSFSQMGGED